MTRTSIVLALLAVLAACKDDPAPARRQHDAAPAPPPPPPVDQEIPEDAPRARLVNLQEQPVDVWLAPTRRFRPVRLAEGVGFGAASPWLAVPADRTTTIVEAGAGPDAQSLGSIDGDGPLSITTLVPIEGMGFGTITRVVAHPDPSQVPLPPVADGTAQVVVALEALYARHEEHRDGESYMVRPWNVLFVDAGKKPCLTPLPQPGVREAAYLAVDESGGVVTVPPGTRRLRFHAEPGCKGKPLATVDLDLTAGERALVAAFTRDHKTLEALAIPLAP